LADDEAVPTVIARMLPFVVVAGLAIGCAGPRATLRPTTAVVGAEERGLASWYGHPYHGRKTSSGEVYDMNAMTAAHRTLPFSTWLHVENLNNGRVVRVRVNDRGPWVDGRVVDVSHAAGLVLGIVGPGVAPVRLRVIAPPAGAAAPPAFALQVGAFTDEAGALALQRTLSDAGVESRVVRAGDGGRELYRVRAAGTFPTRAAADAQAARLAARGHRAIVVSDESLR
jgi:peptidoglycan lytic transglycosylase